MAGRESLGNGLATERVCYAVTAQCLGPVRFGKDMASISHPVKTEAVCLCYARGDAELRVPQADTAKGRSAPASQKSNQNISAPMAS